MLTKFKRTWIVGAGVSKRTQRLPAQGGVEARGDSDTCAQKSSKTAKHTNASKVWTDRPCLPEVASRPEATPVHKNQAKQQSIQTHLECGRTLLAEAGVEAKYNTYAQNQAN